LGISNVREQADLERAGQPPGWLGDDDFHRSHRSSLLGKNPDFYGPVFTDVPPDLPYVWPTKRQPPPSTGAATDQSRP